MARRKSSVPVVCHAGVWKPTGRYEYNGRDCSRDYGAGFASLRPGVTGDGMDLKDRYGQIFFVPDGDDPAVDGYYLVPKDGLNIKPRQD